MERLAYEVVVEDGRFFYKQSGELLHSAGDGNAKWIFVLSTSKTLFVGKKKKGSFQHSSFLAGGATSAAGRLVVEYGVLKVWIWLTEEGSQMYSCLLDSYLYAHLCSFFSPGSLAS